MAEHSMTVLPITAQSVTGQPVTGQSMAGQSVTVQSMIGQSMTTDVVELLTSPNRMLTNAKSDNINITPG